VTEKKFANSSGRIGVGSSYQAQCLYAHCANWREPTHYWSTTSVWI